MKPSSEVTMREVAAAAGVARSTVSKGLRNDPTISEARCRAIQAQAERLGYRPNPLVAALMSQLHHRRRRNDPHHFAWLDLWPKGGEAAAFPFGDALLAGARRRAEALGYAIEVHRVAQEGVPPARLRQILATRAQWGVIIPPVPDSAMHYPLDLRGLTAITLGTSLRDPAIHRVSTNHYQGATLACARLRAKRCERIGLVLSTAVHARVEGKWCGAFLAAQMTWPRAQRLTPLLVGAREKGKIGKWLRRERPDAVLLAEAGVLDELDERGEGERPQVAWLVLRHGQKDAWGIDHRPRQLGAAAVELLVGQIHRNERGVPPSPHTLLLDGEWTEGLTIP